ncbi:retrovirus-related pol polyprotein from transposon TNT 1-94 [Tanacetum coccineum]
MANLSEDIQCAGSDTRPPMLDRTDFASWQQRIRLYCQGKENGVNILKSIDEGPFQMGTFRETLAEGTEGGPHLGPERPRVYSDLSPEDKERYNADIRATNILLQGLPKDIYSLINHYTDAKDIWDNVKMLLEGSELTKEDRESQLYDDFEHFRQNKGETIHDYYVRFAKLINDMRNIKMTMSRMQLNSKFVNNMLPEWGRFVTTVKLNRGLRDSNYDQLYAYLKQHEAHANENKMMLDRFTQHTVDPLALMSNVSHQQHYSQSSTTPPSTYVPPHFADNTQLDSGLSSTDNLIENLTNTLALLTQSYKTYLPQTNNQLRTSSNTRNQATVQDGRVVVQNVQGRQNRGQGNNARGGGAAGYGGAQNRVGNANPGQARQIKCYNCNGIGHIARNCTQPKRPQNSEYFKDKMLLMQAQENGVALDEEQLLFLAGGQDNAIDEDVDEQPVQDLALNVDNVFQADDCDAFDSDVDEAPTAQTMFMANLSSADPVYDEAGPSYDSDILSEVHDHDHYQDAVCEHHEEHEMHDDVQPTYVVDSHADYTSDSNMIPYDQYVKDNAVPVVQSNVSSVPNDAYMMIFNDMHEPHAQSVSDTTRNTVVDNSLTAELFEGIQKALTKEIKEMNDFFEELEAEVDQNVINKKHDEIERKNLLIVNDNLIVDCLFKEVFYIATNSELTVSRVTEMHEAHTIVQTRCLELKAELFKLQDKVQKDDHTKLVKRFSNLEVNHLNLQLKYQNLKESFGNNPSPPTRDTPDFDSVFVIEKMKASIQGKDNAIKKLRTQISQLKETRSEADQNEKVKQHYKELYDSIKITRAKHIEQTTALLTENENLKAQIHENLKCNTIESIKPRVLAPGRYAIDVEPIPPHNRNNREVHLYYLKHLKESVETLREIVEEAKVERPLDRSTVFACRYTKHSQELLEYAISTCPKAFNQRDKKQAPTPLIRKKQVTFDEQCDTSNSNTHKHVKQQNTQKTNVPVPPSTGVNCCTNASGSQPRSNTKKNRISPAKGVNKKKVEEHPRTNKSNLRTTNRVDSSSSSKRTVVQIVLWYLDSGCSKHMTGDRSRLRNFVKKFIRTVRFWNDHFGAIMGYGDYENGNSVISRVYYVEGLGHNLFSVGQFCDSDLEVAFRKHSCYVRDTDGVELIKGSRGSNLYTILVEDMMKSSPICLLSKASKNKSWLWHRRLNHLNFGTINDLARKDFYF